MVLNTLAKVAGLRAEEKIGDELESVDLETWSVNEQSTWTKVDSQSRGSSKSSGIQCDKTRTRR